MIEKLKITTLVDNIAPIGLGFWAEHGLSLLIEADGKKILFDSGQSPEVIAHNLERYNENLNDLRYIVLSHGHYDHTGGLKEIAKRTDNAILFAHPDAFDDKYIKRQEMYKPIGMPFEENELKKHFQLHLDGANKEIISGVTTTGEIPRTAPFEQIPKRFLVRKNDGYVNDKIRDDQAMIVEMRKGIFVISGCAHSGVINTLNRVKEITGKDKIWGLCGGTHLFAAKDHQLYETAKVMRHFNLQSIGLSHCSGVYAYQYLQKVFGEKVFLNKAGSVIEV
jgi:7,8-dihydropterin-6-yl-methyl-4-(beta-D-ribofuranosyl)aminobenzene 5'-phosphate synthase